MPSWGEILQELSTTAVAHGGQVDYDAVRRKYLTQLNALTHRDTIVYATDWLRGGGPMSSIDLGDMQGMMEVCQGLNGPELDLILHSPGGSAEATASIVRYLRRNFSNIRVFVPLAAMSAATMWALAGDEILMGKHSQLGPIDPQLVTLRGVVPARAVIEQFERAKEEVQKNPSALGAWVPILQQYGPALIEQCEKADELAQRLVREWLADYMFSGQPKAGEKAEQAARYFSNYETHQSHSLGIDRDQARGEAGVQISDLEADQSLQDAILSVHHATLHTFSGAAVKIIENHQGRAFVLQQGVVIPPQGPGGMAVPFQQPQNAPPAPPFVGP